MHFVVLKLFLFVLCILNRVYIVMYVVLFSEAPLPQYLNWLTLSGSALSEGNLHVYLTRWDTICVACHNGIVHSHQLCSVENASTYTFIGFCCLVYVMHSVVIAIFNCFFLLGW